jgi:hypothetical protein
VNTTLNSLVSQQRTAEFRSRAQRWSKQADGFDRRQPASVELRVARVDETPDVRRLAQLDDAPELEGPAMLAVVGGEAVAAMSLSDLRIVANPFVRTQHAVKLLRLRGAHLSDPRERRRPRRLLRPRFAA